MIRFVTDSASNIPGNLLQIYNIVVVPSYIFWENKEYREGSEINYEKLFSSLTGVKTLPMTAPPSSSEFVKTYINLSKEAEFIFSIHISSGLSNIYKFSSIAAETFKTQKSMCEIEVIDTKNIDFGSGMITLEAARYAKLGKHREEIKKLIEELIKKMRVYIYVDTLEYLIKGGRVSKLAGILAGFLNVKPLLSIEDGNLINKEKITGREKVKEVILKLISEEVNPSEKIKVAVLDCLCKEEGDRLLEEIKKNFNCAETFRNNFSTTVALHIGPKALGVVFYKI